MMILCRLLCQGFLCLFSSFSFPSFFHERLFFSSQEKKINIVPGNIKENLDILSSNIQIAKFNDEKIERFYL